jgi:cobalt-precorrin-5B (C1)-methyltransferase
VSRRRLRSGFTTGTAAAAAAKAAVMLAFGNEVERVDVSLPDGGGLNVPVAWSRCIAEGTCQAMVVKDAGDDPDVTNKAKIMAEVKLSPEVRGKGAMRICGGEGVGLVTKPGLPLEPGNAAINPVPRQMIAKAVRQALAWAAPDEEYEVVITISVEKGEKLAQRTLNPRLGILGGISILGTTGRVKPFSHEAYTETIDLGLSVANAEGVSEVVLTTGGKSEKRAMALRSDLPETAFVQIADFFGYALKACTEAGMQRVGLVSFFGKAVKQAAGLEYTHAHKAAMDLPLLAEWLRAAGLQEHVSAQIAQANTARQALDILRAENLLGLATEVGRRMLRSASSFAGPDLDVWAVIIDYDGTVLYSGSKPGAAK